MIYAWTIKKSCTVACGVICATTQEKAEKQVREDWNLQDGDFSYSRIADNSKKTSILLYKVAS